MARTADTTSALADANALAHPADRRATAAPGGDTTPRRALRRRFLMEAGATLAVALAPVAAVLAPDPVWGAAERRGAATLPDPDAHLVALCAAEVARSEQIATILKGDGTGIAFDMVLEVWELQKASIEAQAAIAALPAFTGAGARAKAAVVQHHWSDSLAARRGVAASLVDDLLRLLPAEGGRA